MMQKIIMIDLFYIFLSISIAQTNWVRVGYHWYSMYDFPVSEINSSLFTHIICAYTAVNSSSYQLSLSPAEEEKLSTFTLTVRQNNPSVTTLLSIGGVDANYSTFSSMVSNSSYRKSFIDSSIRIARRYGFQGLDFVWIYPNTTSDLFNMGVLFKELKVAADLEAKHSNQSQLILTAAVYCLPVVYSESFPIAMIQQNLDWVHVVCNDLTTPLESNFTGAHAALYDPSTLYDTNYGIREWINGGLSANKIVLVLFFYGYAWTLKSPMDNGIGAEATGGRTVTYRKIKNYIEDNGRDVPVMYNSTYVVNYWSKGTTWIGFDDVEAIRAKVSYAKEKKLLGYSVWEVSFDFNWALSKAAAEVEIKDSSVQVDNESSKNKKRSSLAVPLSTTAAVALLIGIVSIFSCWRRNLKLKASSAGDFHSNIPSLTEYTLAEIEAATNGFSIENKLGQGGYGPVYKGILPNGEVIAAKKLSKTSTQGFEEFKNEVMLTAKLQHVNLVRVLGFCIDKEEQILIYEYMQNKSLDLYLFDPIRRLSLDWKKRVHIIEGITQGLLYLQEYSRLTIIHRDLKVSNVLLDKKMNSKISDFGMARIFAKDDLEANTSRIVGTIGYVPPEYALRGTYSTKSDVYSFGVLLLQIISGKWISFLYGPNENLSLLDYAYELWNHGKAMEFMDETLDDSSLSCKLTRCLHIALLCVQENPMDRPSMPEVFSMLKTEMSDMMIPKKPAFSKQNESTTINLKGHSGCSSSVNNVTISDVSAR
ncbi:putative cysteine-rich receptor-like protein kinase 12 [Mangifera indica]|uniref:putative cysteine-rich receptor-like protein kinase 12 n=1 Tax=Mangifera indica TaxID=29780 RepID=UPI001CFB818A|nr:putative cysteine-rich receptor-like protein kinase 12 [Mangifera indica]